MLAFVEFVLPPEKYWSAEKTVPVDVVYAPPPALIRTVLKGVAPVPVVNVQPTEPASAVPSAALIVAARFAVYVVEGDSGEVGLSVARNSAGSYDTVAGTVAPPGARSVKLEPVIVVASMPRENVAVTVLAVLTPVLPSPGERSVTVGGPGGPAVVGTITYAFGG